MHARARLVASLLSAALLGLTGCEMINEATAPIDRRTLIEDMTKQLDRGKSVLYEAEYQLAGGHRGNVAQEVAPPRAVYEYPGGMLIVNGVDQTQCDVTKRPARCQLRLVSSFADEPLAPFGAATKQGLMTGPVVADLLRIASLQPQASVKPQSTTIAGQPASCLEISGLVDAPASSFMVCVTADGVLASFAGVVDGYNVDQALIQVHRRLTDGAFEVPRGAQVVDLRQPTTSSSIG